MPRDLRFADRVKSYRKREGISQEEFANRLGISRNYVSMIEGGHEPSEQVRLHFSLLESSPLPPAAPGQAEKVNEDSPDYGLLKKIIFLEEHGTPAQLEMVDGFLDSLCRKLGFEDHRKGGKE